jgi:hypothetical protein
MRPYYWQQVKGIRGDKSIIPKLLVWNSLVLKNVRILDLKRQTRDIQEIAYLRILTNKIRKWIVWHGSPLRIKFIGS